MTYVPEWERLASALRRVMDSGRSRREAQHDICAALSDDRIEARPWLDLVKLSVADHQMAHRYAQEIMKFVHDLRNGINRYPEPWELYRPFGIPSELRPSHLDWRTSSFKRPRSIQLRPDIAPAMLWIVSIKLSSADITNVLCGGITLDLTLSKDPSSVQSRQPKLDTQAGNLNKLTVAGETAAIVALADYLKSDLHMTRDNARKWLKLQSFTFSERGFQHRVWPKAREMAKLDLKAPPGRKPKSPR